MHGSDLFSSKKSSNRDFLDDKLNIGFLEWIFRMDFEKLNYLVILPRFCSKLVKKLEIKHFFANFRVFLSV